MLSSYFSSAEGCNMLMHSSRAVKLALYMKRFSGRRSLKSASGLRIMIKCRKRSEACEEIERAGKKNTHKNRPRDVVPGIDRPLANGVAEMCSEKIDNEDESVKCDEQCSYSAGARERLQNYRLQMAGNVWIPDTWGHEDRLKDWADPKVFEIHSNGLVVQSARTALIEDCARREPSASILVHLK